MPNAIDSQRPVAPAPTQPVSGASPTSVAHHSRPAQPDRISSDPEVATSGPLKGIRYGREMAAAAAQHHVDPVLVAAIAAQESGGPGAINGNAAAVQQGGGGRGLMQPDIRWHQLKNPFDPAENADKGAEILRNNMVREHGNVRKAVQEYNTGPVAASGTTQTWPDGKVMNYADSVMRHYQDIKTYVEAQNAKH
jgi:soluble lytic murein transglycosylase-like protein